MRENEENEMPSAPKHAGKRGRIPLTEGSRISTVVTMATEETNAVHRWTLAEHFRSTELKTHCSAPFYIQRDTRVKSTCPAAFWWNGWNMSTKQKHHMGQYGADSVAFRFLSFLKLISVCEARSQNLFTFSSYFKTKYSSFKYIIFLNIHCISCFFICSFH